MDVFIVTGTTSGIGKELVKQLLEQGKIVFGISRSQSDINHENYHHAKLDLAESSLLEPEMKKILVKALNNASSLTLINNAGTIEPIGLAGNLSAEDIAKSIAVNLTAPMILTSAFIHASAAIAIPKRVLQISSGAGRKGYEGWSSYCAGKAGLDRFTEAVQLEEANKPNGVRLVSIAPGIIDTNMQGKIRSSSEEEFPLVERFKDYKASGQLSSAEEVARKLIEFVQSDRFEKAEVLSDLRIL